MLTRLLLVMVTLFTLAGCATPLHRLPSNDSKAICGFLAQRAQQGDYLGCYLAAQRAAAKDPYYGRLINPEVLVEAVVVWDKYGGVKRISDLTTSLPASVSKPPLACFRDALGATRLPPPGRSVKVPITISVDGRKPAVSKGADNGSVHCLMGPGNMDF
jgi:hypothetical protein